MLNIEFSLPILTEISRPPLEPGTRALNPRIVRTGLQGFPSVMSFQMFMNQFIYYRIFIKGGDTKSQIEWYDK